MSGKQAHISAAYMHPGCLDWDTHYPPNEQDNQRNLRLWEDTCKDPPTLEAWAMYWRHEGTFDLFASLALHGTHMHEAVMDEYLTWSESRAREDGMKQLLPFWVLEYDKVMDHLLKAHGFEVVPPSGLPAPLFERTLGDLPSNQTAGWLYGARGTHSGRRQATHPDHSRRIPAQ